MRGPEASDGVSEVPLGRALALFADASAGDAAADAAVLARRAGGAFATRAGCGVPVLYAQQVHGATSYVYAAHRKLGEGPHLVGRCDALITAEPLVALTVRTADCLPVALAGGGVVAMVHAGWRGLAAGILGTVVRRFATEFGVAAAGLEAVVGVGVGACHYPVGDEVRGALARLGVAPAVWDRGAAVDLQALAVARLHGHGLPPGAVTALAGCTYCDGRHHSYRRDGAAAGRQWGAVMLLA